MSDRLPEPQRSVEIAFAERASATPSRPTRVRAAGAGSVAAAPPPPGSLVELQRWLVDAIIAADPTAAQIAEVITPGPRLDPAGRLAIYQFGYVARLVECLLDDYPVLAASLGDDRFDVLCRAYVARHPSTSPSLNFFGRHMAGFCREADSLSEAERAFYADLARLEWSIVEVIHARTAAPLDPKALQAIPVEAFASARFEPSPAVRLLRLAHPANAFFRAYRESGALTAVPAPAPAAVVVYRKEAAVWRMDLTPAMTDVLGALLSGATLGAALETIDAEAFDADALAEAERSVMIWFREWVEGGLFAGIGFGDPE
jgi:hypothetical protein